MAVSLNSVVGFNSTLRSNCPHVSRSNNVAPIARNFNFSSSPFIFRPSRVNTKRQGLCHSVSNSDQVAIETNATDSRIVEASTSDTTGSQNLEVSNESVVSSDMKPDNLTLPELQSTKPKTRLTAREKLKAARVLGRNTETKTSKAQLGSSVLDSLKESDRGKKRSRLPEAPTNMLDDSKRGMPAPGWTFQFPGGADLFFIIFSFVFITTVMCGTTYVVWKLGAIHFNEN